MSQKILINTENAFNYFYFQAFSSASVCVGFDCGLKEYNDYLLKDALRSTDDHIAFTWLLIERATDKVTAYMSLIIANSTSKIIESIKEEDYATAALNAASIVGIGLTKKADVSFDDARRFDMGARNAASSGSIGTYSLFEEQAIVLGDMLRLTDTAFDGARLVNDLSNNLSDSSSESSNNGNQAKKGK